MRQLIENVKEEIKKYFFNGKNGNKANKKNKKTNFDYNGYYCNTTRWQTV